MSEEITSISEDYKIPVPGYPGSWEYSADPLKPNEQTREVVRSKGHVDIHNVWSEEQLEDDVRALMGNESSLLNTVERKELMQSACIEVLTYFGKYLSQEHIERVFPNLDLDNLESYDFSSSKVKVIILSPEDYELLDQKLNSRSEDSKSGSTAAINTLVRNRSVDRYTDHTTKNVIRIWDTFKSKSCLIFIKEPENEPKEGAVPMLKDRLRHELYHELKYRWDMSLWTREGVTEVFNRLSDPELYKNKENYQPAYYSYEENVRIILMSFYLCEQEGMKSSEIYSAFLGGNKDAMAKFYKTLEKTTCREFANDLLIGDIGLYPPEGCIDIMRYLETRPKMKNFRKDPRSKIIHWDMTYEENPPLY